MIENEPRTPVQAYHKWELCKLYKIGERAFNAWIKPFEDRIGKQLGKCYTPEQVRIIFECLGEP